MSRYIFLILFIPMSCGSEISLEQKVLDDSSLKQKDLSEVISGDIVVEVEPSDDYRIPRRKLEGTFTFLWPYDDLQITSPYGFRLHPVLKTIKYHRGLDLSKPVGSRVYAVADGRVVKILYNGVYGNLVEVEHIGGFISQYAHLSEILVLKDDFINAGTIVGLTGSTGRSTGSHLHLGFIAKTHSVDPFYFISRLWDERSLQPEKIPSLHGWK
ncbi:MAG: M23 family metallopeptidase [Deltaproteobacteria bacterium]|nr:M23 family metallopeptidase [Deltaproteobacteria bacterium]